MDNQKAKCRCPDRYSGDRCQTDVCLNHCLNGATCTALRGQPICSCTDRYEGLRCKRDKCNGFCYHDSKCEILNGQPSCICEGTYGGSRCLRDLCDNYCYNSGTCEVNSVSNDRKPVCHCSSPYGGERCEKNLCKDVVCYNDGVCESLDGESAQCSCKPLFSGTSCLDDLCEGICQNGGVCFDNDGAINCNCTEEYGGRYCDHAKAHPDECECKHGDCVYDKTSETKMAVCKCYFGWEGPSCEYKSCEGYCKNSGTCSKTNNKLKCSCTAEFSGNQCELKKASEELCEHLNCGLYGICVHTDGGDVVCHCNDDWDGSNCDQPIHGTADEQKSSDSSTSIAVAVPIILLVIVIIIILGIILYRRRASQYQGFQHKRMKNGGGATNVEIGNPTFLYDQTEDDDGAPDLLDTGFNLDPDKPTNFSNPMYDTLYSGGPSASSSLASLEEKKENLLLKTEDETTPLNPNDGEDGDPNDVDPENPKESSPILC
ncbi:uncharacterized protein LOC102804602 [Saccoglossus kowalevskii]|uniref:Low-density lipoprotein receptor-related protein 1-like n=1 Tax=Saccoglossus kowalevskii TaxID=10224 RepID=A0ABM0MPC2_SACKO|nr:PREDICTED: low-density lipoprotein receptor-related protein 1-like [Saccoglossus kowalevskii]